METNHNSLQALGFTEYESKAYLALLRQNPATAYELAKRSGIPSSKIYQVMARLVERQCALPLTEEQSGAGTTRYVPLSAQELVQRLREESGARLDSLERQLAQEERAESLSYIWNFAEGEELRLQLQGLARSARREFIASLWLEELDLLQAVLPALAAAGRRLALVVYGGVAGAPPALPGWLLALGPAVRVYPHPIADTLYAERGGRGLSAVADGEAALTATIHGDGSVEGAHSKNRGFALLAEDYIKHDIYLMKIVARLDPSLNRLFGPRYQLLRDVYNDQEQTRDPKSPA